MQCWIKKCVEDFLEQHGGGGGGKLGKAPNKTQIKDFTEHHKLTEFWTRTKSMCDRLMW